MEILRIRDYASKALQGLGAFLKIASVLSSSDALTGGSWMGVVLYLAVRRSVGEVSDRCEYGGAVTRLTLAYTIDQQLHCLRAHCTLPFLTALGCKDRQSRPHNNVLT